MKTPEVKTPAAAKAPSVSTDLASWLEGLEQAEHASSEEYPKDVRQRLFYCLWLAPSLWDEKVLLVEPVATRLLKNDGLSKSRVSYSPQNVMQQSGGASFLRPSDRLILRRIHLERTGYDSYRGGYQLAGRTGAALLTQIIETGRCHWGDPEGPCLVAGATVAGTLSWTLLPDGAQRPILESPQIPSAILLPLSPPWYLAIDPDTNVATAVS